jgi:hypothetical protein
MTFEAIYYTDNENDDGYRVIEATDLQDAKAVLKAQMEAEGMLSSYRLSTLIQTMESFLASKTA